MPKITLKRASQIVAIVAASVFITSYYSRADYKHWIDADRDCQNTRQEVLISESLEEVTFNSKGCKVISGKWYDPYTNQYWPCRKSPFKPHLNFSNFSKLFPCY